MPGLQSGKLSPKNPLLIEVLQDGGYDVNQLIDRLIKLSNDLQISVEIQKISYTDFRQSLPQWLGRNNPSNIYYEAFLRNYGVFKSIHQYGGVKFEFNQYWKGGSRCEIIWIN